MLNEIINKISQHGGTCFLVGGAVRDEILGLDPKDQDIEVFGLNGEQLQSILSEFGEVNLVGRAFGIFKLNEFDFSLPRRDSKNGFGHKGFSVESDSNMTIEMAASRRDFTINAISKNLHTGEIVDPFWGVSDLQRGILRPVWDKTFVDDPLRVLRGMQFAARFSLVGTSDLFRLTNSIQDRTLPKGRIWGEWEKLFLKGVKPSLGLHFLMRTGWLNKELADLINCPQEPDWHPEGDVWTHTLCVCDAAADICVRENITGNDRLIVMLGALCHDLGKPATTIVAEKITSAGHQNFLEPTITFLDSIGCPESLRPKVIQLVEEHMVHLNEPNARLVRRLLARLHVDLKLLSAVIEADHSGRPPLPGGKPENLVQIELIAQEMGNKIEPIVMGRHLIELGFKPGKEMGELLKELFHRQLDGDFNTLDEAITLITRK